MNFNFTNWHLVPKDATIPAGTPYWRYVSEEGEGSYHGRGIVCDLGPTERWPDDDYYTEEPIPSPEEEAIENRARNMYYLTGGTGWEYADTDVRGNWLHVAAKYVEKETD